MLKKVIVFLLFGITILFAAVDVNHATSKELQSIKGIGPKKAKRIIHYRKKHCFESVDELVKIQGIGKKTIEKIKPEVILRPCR